MLPSSSPSKPAAKRNSKRLQVDDQGQRVTRVPSRSISKSENPTSPGSVNVSRKSSLVMSKDRGSIRSNGGTPTQGASRVSSTTRTELNDLEQKTLAANSLGTGVQRFEQRSSATRKISMTELEREKKIAAAGMRTTSDQHIEHRSSTSRKLSVTELEREKKIAAGMRTTGEQHLEHRSTSRKLSVTELELEKKLAASGMRTTPSTPSPRGSARNSLRNALSRASIRSERASTLAAKEGKVLQDQTGREIDLDAEFARLHSGTMIGDQPGAPANIEEYDDDGNLIPAAPGAIAVYGAQYDGDEDLEPDYVNPDNFDAAARLLAQQEAASRSPETPEESPGNPREHYSCVQEALAESMHGDSISGQHKLFPGSERERRRCLPVIIVAIVVIAVSIGVGVAVGTRGGGSEAEATPAPTTYQPSLSPTTESPTASPTTFAPSRTMFPSLLPSSAPSKTPWLLQAEFGGENFGSSVGIIADTISFSDGVAIHSYEILGSEWTQVGQILTGDAVRLSESKRMAAKDGSLLRVYDLVANTWIQVGSDIEAETDTFSFQISNDGSTIVISDLVSVVRQNTKMWRFDGGEWLQWGQDVVEINGFTEPAGNALSFDGSRAVLSYDSISQSVMYNAPDDIAGRWITGSDEGDSFFQEGVFGGGPAVALSEDSVTLITCGAIPTQIGVVSIYNTTQDDPTDPIKQVGLENHQGIALLALRSDGRRLAYAWQNNLRVVELGNDGWQDKGDLPEIMFNIASISFSSDGKLAVGQPDGNVIQILEIMD